MHLPAATHKITFALPYASSQEVRFANREVRETMAKLGLKQLLQANKLKDSGDLFQRLRFFLDHRRTSNQNFLKDIQTSNNQLISLAIDRNNKKLKLKESDQAENAQAQPSEENRQILEESQQLEALRSHLEPHQQLIGFIGNGIDSVVNFKGDKTDSFGDHAFAVIRDAKKGKVSLEAISTERLNENRPGHEKFSSALASLEPKISEHKEYTEIHQKLMSDKPRSHISRLKESLFGKKETVSTGAEAGGAACCTIMSLDELANVGQRTDHDHGEIITPANASEGALTGFVSYASLAGIKIASDIYGNYKGIVKDIHKAQQSLDLLKLENQHLFTETAQLKPEFSERKEAIAACEHFLKQQKSEATFQKNVAGALSGLASLSIFLGQFVAKVSPIGLYLLSAFGAGHVVHIGHQLLKACKDYKATAPQTIEHHHFRKKIKNLGLALTGWSLYTAGTATLGTMSLGMMGAAIKTGAAPAIVITGIALLGAGIAGTLIFNNIMTSKRFFPGMPMLGRLDPKDPPSKKSIQEKLLQDEKLRAVAKKYRQVTFDALVHKNPLGYLKNNALRYTNKLGLYITLGLIPAPFMNNKFKIKGSLTHSIQKMQHDQHKNRFDAMQKLFDMESITNPSLMKDSYYKYELKEFNNATQAFLEAAPKESARETKLNKLHNMITALENTPKSDQIMKIFAKKVINDKNSYVKKSGPVKQNGYIGQFIPEKKKQYFIRDQYEVLFQGPHQEQNNQTPNVFKADDEFNMAITSYKQLNKDFIDPLCGLFKTPPCCSANGYANIPVGILNEFREKFTSDSHHTEEAIDLLNQTLQECIDQYLLYQARNNAKEDIAMHANYLRSFDKVEEKMKTLKA